MRPLDRQSLAASPETIVITPPTGGAPVAFSISAGSVLSFEGFTLSDATLNVVGNHLVVSMEGTPDILLLNFVTASQDEDSIPYYLK